jgi:hypothetical protein
MIDAWRESKRREQEAKDAAAISEFMRDHEFQQQEGQRPPSLPALGDVWVRPSKAPPPD